MSRFFSPLLVTLVVLTAIPRCLLAQNGKSVHQVAAIFDPADVPGDEFGASVAIQGTTAVVGAPFHPLYKPGAAYVYKEPETGWQDMTETAELGVPVNFGLQLGHSVAVSGNLVLAGAPRNTIGHNSQQGSVIGYLKPAGGWKNTTSPNGAASASDGQAMEEFGSSVAISGNNVIVGAPDDGDDLEGAAYIFSLQ